MNQETNSSFFDGFNKQGFQGKIWEKFQHSDYKVFIDYYKNDIIECEFSCHRVSRKKQILKAISISIGIECLYISKNNQFQGILPLTFTIMKSRSYNDRVSIQLIRNQHSLDLIVTNYDQIYKILALKCVLTTFHDDYYVESKLGKGSFAFVFLANKKTTGVHYAVKAFNKENVLNQKKGKEGLENEIQVMRKLKQENILNLLEVHETINSIYLVMDFCEGGSLSQPFPQKLRSTFDVQKIMFNLLKGIHYMHSKKFMHRDLKPSNILLRTRNNETDVVIADFGLATFLESKPIFRKCGTPGYVAPEILNCSSEDQLYNEKCDIFSAGVIFYFLMTGKSIFGNKDIQSVILKNKNCSINYEVKKLKEASGELRDILKKMLEEKPNQRISAEDCLKHPFFKILLEEQEIIASDQQLLSSTETLSSDLPELSSIDSQKKCYQQQIKEREFNGNIKTIGSITLHSQISSPKEKQTEKLSKFSQFCQAMETLQKESQKQKKQNQDSLHKVIVKKAFLQKMNSLDTDFVIENIAQVQVTKIPEPRKSWVKKSNSLDV